MTNKQDAMNAVNRAIGFVRAIEPCNDSIRELNSVANFINEAGQHEEYKAAWLSLTNAINSIDPQWLEKYHGESEWQKACAFIAEQNKALKKVTTEQDKLKCTYVGVDFAATVSENISQQIQDDLLFNVSHPFPKFSRYERGVYFRDVLRSVAITQIREELSAAESKHPTWPTDVIHATAILNEEAGELTQAAIDYHYHNGSLEKVRREATQVGAMAIRVLINLPYAKRPGEPVTKANGVAW
ncbi:hypothetical protein [Serratia sp. EWG9]|uniref:hypothetical protein n=1 Tax=Serratia sp. EWG9 TaxID=2785628 RepID=UPI001CA8155D|nr:hypothetical protein [Serratia sp. EWG9]MBZ0046107.1 hypothetical protein [Serratia sp. EWG9]